VDGGGRTVVPRRRSISAKPYPEQIDSADWDRAFEDALFLDVITEHTAGPSRPRKALVRRQRHGRRATRGCRRYN
jgi:hypothetical protein